MEKDTVSLTWEVFCGYLTSLTNTLDLEGKNLLDTLLPLLITHRVVSYGEMEEIEVAVSPSEKLLYYMSKPVSVNFNLYFEKFLQIMANAGNEATRKLAVEIMKALGTDPSELKIEALSTSKSWLVEEIFLNYYAELIATLRYDVENLLPLLITHRVLNLWHIDVIDKAISPSKKLIDIISATVRTKSKGAFEKLLQIMANAGNGATQKLAVQILEVLGLKPTSELKIEFLSKSSLMEIFLNYYANLTATLKYDVENLLPLLVKMGVVADSDKVTATISSAEKVKRLLMVISCSFSAAGYQKSFMNLLDIMKNGNEATQCLASEILNMVESRLSESSDHPKEDTLPFSVNEIFINNYENLSEVLSGDLENLMPQFISQRLLTVDNKIAIESINLVRDKVRELLGNVVISQNNVNHEKFEKFLQVMNTAGNAATQYLASKINKEIDEANILAKLEKAKASNETLKVSYTTILFTGSSGVGKTNLIKKLNKESLNAHHHSTGVAESKHAICVRTAAVVKCAKGLQWTNLDYDSMIAHLNKHLRNLRFPSVCSSTPEENSASDLDRKSHHQQASSISSNPASLSQHKTNTRESIKLNKAVETDITKADVTITPSLGDVWDIINFLDTGGQPEFVNIFPAISSSIALTFIVFNLSKKLDSLVHVQHNVKGHPSFESYYLDCTNSEFIKRLMVSSENFNKNIVPSLPSIQRKDGGSDPKICYVGTHAFKISEGELQQIDRELSSIANEHGLHCRSCWSSPKLHLNRLFPIDLFEEPGLFDDIIKDICDNIQSQVQRQDYYDVPITWFIFLLKLQKLCQAKEVSYISYQKAVDEWMDVQVDENTDDELARKSNKHKHDSVCRNSSDVCNILLFFHLMGMLFYFHKVEGMCDYVFIDRQWLFKKLTELVELKFTINYSKKCIDAEALEKFTLEGKLNVDIIENLKIDLQGIKPLYFIHLLNHLNIIAPIDSKRKDYFMPCVLPSFSLETQKNYSLEEFYGTIQHTPLLIRPENGPMPHGIFCHMIVELLRNLPAGWNPPYESTEEVQHSYNNLITFVTTWGHAITLFFKIGYLEIQVRHEQSYPISIHYDVLCTLIGALNNVAEGLQLKKKQFCYGFYCKCKKVQHFAKLKELKSSTEYISCGHGNTKLTEDHKVWLQIAKDCPNNSKQLSEKGPGSISMDSANSEILQKEPKIGDLFEFVVPSIKAHWDNVAYTALRYDVPTVESIQRNHSNDVKRCCQEMFKIWLTTSHGIRPKTWSNLLTRLKKVDEVVDSTKVIEKKLKAYSCDNS